MKGLKVVTPESDNTGTVMSQAFMADDGEFYVVVLVDRTFVKLCIKDLVVMQEAHPVEECRCGEYREALVGVVSELNRSHLVEDKAFDSPAMISAKQLLREG